MPVVLTAGAHDDFGAGLARPEVDFLLMEDDGSLVDMDGSPVAAGGADPEVAWGTSHLFRAGAPRPLLSPAPGEPRGSAGSSPRPPATTTPPSPPWWPGGSGSPTPTSTASPSPNSSSGPSSKSSRTPDSGEDWRRAGAFGAEVIGCRRHPSPDDSTDRTVIPEEFDGVVGLADVVVLALLEALDSGHLAAGGIGRFARQTDLFRDNLDRYLDGRPLRNEVTDVIATGG